MLELDETRARPHPSDSSSNSMLSHTSSQRRRKRSLPSKPRKVPRRSIIGPRVISSSKSGWKSLVAASDDDPPESGIRCRVARQPTQAPAGRSPRSPPTSPTPTARRLRGRRSVDDPTMLRPFPHEGSPDRRGATRWVRQEALPRPRQAEKTTTWSPASTIRSAVSSSPRWTSSQFLDEVGHGFKPNVSDSGPTASSHLIRTPGSKKSEPKVATLELGIDPSNDLHVLLRHRPRSIALGDPTEQYVESYVIYWLAYVLLCTHRSVDDSAIAYDQTGDTAVVLMDEGPLVVVALVEDLPGRSVAHEHS